MKGDEKKHRGFFLAIWVLVQILFVLIFVSPQWIEEVAVKEDALIESYLGDETAQYISEVGWKMYWLSLVKTGVQQSLRSMFIATTREKANSRGMERIGDSFWFPAFERVGQVLYVLTRQAFDRLAGYSLWAIPALVIVIPSLWSGYNMWKIKQFSFDHPSAFIQTLALKVIVYTVLGFVLLLFFPFVIPPVMTPIVMMILVPVAIMMFVSNLPKKI